MRVVSPAKINLHLRVGPVRLDGFHPLKTWMVTVGLFDTLNFLPNPHKEAAGTVGIVSDDPNVPKYADNLIIRAAKCLWAARPAASIPEGLVVEVIKTIPIGGGLGGGSSNAAATLSALNTLWAMKLSPSRLATIAAQLGSDVPFFLDGPSAWCSGRGEQISPIAPPACRWAVLILPDFPMPTAAVYQRFDALQPESPTAAFENEDDLSDWSTLSAKELLPRLVNDLERPAFDLRTELAGLRDAAEDVAGRPVRMSGSGSTLFTLFDTKERAEQAEQEIRQRLTPKWGLTALTVRIAP